MKFNNKIRKCWLLLPLLLFTVTCTHVSPYQRERLASQRMALQANPSMDQLHAHVHENREGAVGGVTTTGGGCGCN